MNLNEPTQENLKYILNELADRLDIANRILVNDEDNDLNRYDELKYMYDLVVIKNQLNERHYIANRILVNDEDYDINSYDELKYMYDVVVRKNQLSVSEKHAFIDELRSVRK